ncbi:MAG: hypothetical protein QW756_00095 [Nitrososphaerota archaeon]
MRHEDEANLIESFSKIESYKPIFEMYKGYDNRVMPGTITAIGETEPGEVTELPGRNILMVGVPTDVFGELWEGFRETASFHLLDPLVGQGYDLWVVAAPQHKLRRVTWIVFPVTDDDLQEVKRNPSFSVVLVPVESQSFEELTDRVDNVIGELKKGGAFPASSGIILLVDLTEVFGP